LRALHAIIYLAAKAAALATLFLLLTISSTDANAIAFAFRRSLLSTHCVSNELLA
jgi:hypothetical protein